MTESKLLRRFRPNGRNLAGLFAGYYVAELLGALTDENDPHPELFDLADVTLAALAEGGATHRWLARFELGALRLLGHMPLLDRCAECGAAVELVERMAFGAMHGGVLCKACRPGKSDVASVTAGMLKTMKVLADPHGQAWKRIEIDLRMWSEMRSVLNHYFVNLLGREPRMYRYLHEFWK